MQDVAVFKCLGGRIAWEVDKGHVTPDSNYDIEQHCANGSKDKHFAHLSRIALLQLCVDHRDVDLIHVGEDDQREGRNDPTEAEIE